jgi:hypothetical protein
MNLLPLLLRLLLAALLLPAAQSRAFLPQSRYTNAPSGGGAWETRLYGYDGHGSVRFLTGADGAVTDTYFYDAFGSLVQESGSTPNDYLYAGEQFDPDLGLYHLRAQVNFTRQP